MSSFEQILYATQCGACRIKRDSGYSLLEANAAFYSLLELPPETTCRNITLRELLPASEFAAFHTAFDKNAGHDQHIFDFELPVENTRGLLIWLIVRACYDAEHDSFACTLTNVSKQKQREEELRINEETLRIASKHYNIMLIRYHIPSKTLLTPKETAEVFDLAESIPNWPDVEQVHNLVPDSSLAVYRDFFARMVAGVPQYSSITQLRDRMGQFAWYRGDYTLIYDYKNEPLYAIISFSDVTIQREKEIAYEKWVELFRSQERDSVGYYESNLTKDIFEQVSGVLMTMLPDLQGAPFSRTIRYVAEHLVVPEDKENYLKVFDCAWLIAQYASNNRKIRYEHRRIDKDGNVFWAKAVLQMFEDPYSNDIKCFTVIMNIDKQKRDHIELEKRSQVDKLTGLLNRVTIIEKINDTLAVGGVAHACVMIDVDYFKQLNDTMGHIFGDDALREISAVLRDSVRKDDVVGRLGGDEFIIFMKNIVPGAPLQKKVQAVCKKLRKKCAGNIMITGSLGVSLYPRDGVTFEDLYLKADTALYEAKRRGRNQVVIYSEAGNSTADERVADTSKADERLADASKAGDSEAGTA